MAETRGSFEDILAGAPPELRPLCEALRRLILSLHPEAVEIAWPRMHIASYGVGPRKMTEHYAYIAPQKRHVNLGLYHGVTLADPNGLLEGTGKGLRHIKLRSLTEAQATAVAALLKAAIQDRKRAAG